MSEANGVIEQEPVTKGSLLEEAERRSGPAKTSKERRLRDLAADLWLHIDRHSMETAAVPGKEKRSWIKRLPRMRMRRPATKTE